MRIQKGEIGVMLTDTIYGVVGSALDERVVERVYEIKKRDKSKPFLVLISDMKDLEQFKVVMSDEERNVMRVHWPGALTIILSVTCTDCAYLHRGTQAIAFRLPDKKQLRDILKETGPMIAPSANPQGFAPALSTHEARAYFGKTVDFYIDEGVCAEGTASTIVDCSQNSCRVVRQGGVQI